MGGVGVASLKTKECYICMNNGFYSGLYFRIYLILTVLFSFLMSARWNAATMIELTILKISEGFLKVRRRSVGQEEALFYREKTLTSNNNLDLLAWIVFPAVTSLLSDTTRWLFSPLSSLSCSCLTCGCAEFTWSWPPESERDLPRSCSRQRKLWERREAAERRAWRRNSSLDSTSHTPGRPMTLRSFF